MMMNVSVLLLVIGLLAGCAGKKELSSNNLCSYYGENIESVAVNFTSSSEAKDIISEIINVIGLKPRFEIRSARIPNAAAVIHNNKRYVLYNPEFVSELNKQAGNKWASVSILAHEIGHHLNGHTLEQGGSRPDIELEADEFSGFVLRKMGATLKDAQAAMSIAANVKASHTHPDRASRLKAIERGWMSAGEPAARSNNSDTGTKANKPAIIKAPEVSEALDDKYKAFTVFFNADKDGEYYVTIRNNLVKVVNDRLYIIGRLAQSNKSGFPLMLHDKVYNYLYINSRGNILNDSGQKIGIIRKYSKS